MMNKWAEYVNARTGEVVDELPAGAKEVDFESGKHSLPNWKTAPNHANKWVQLALAGGGGLLAHSLMSSALENDDEEEEKNESVWRKLLRILAPLGAGAAGAYGGYMLGKSAQDNSEDLFYDPSKALKDLEAGESSWASPLMWGGGVGASVGGLAWGKRVLDERKLGELTAEYNNLATPLQGANRRAEAVEPHLDQGYHDLSTSPSTPQARKRIMKDISKMESFARRGATTTSRPPYEGIRAGNLAKEIGRIDERIIRMPNVKAWGKGGLFGGLGSLGLGWLLDLAAENNRQNAKKMQRPQE